MEVWLLLFLCDCFLREREREKEEKENFLFLDDERDFFFLVTNFHLSITQFFSISNNIYFYRGNLKYRGK